MHTDTLSIGDVAQMLDLPVSTLRYYDREGLLPGLQRRNGVRRFGPTQLEALRVIECLKGAGVEIKDIRRFMDWCEQGPETFGQRRELFETQLATVEAQIAHLERIRAMIRFKCWYYERAIEDGSEDFAQNLPDEMPEQMRVLYDLAHS
ncbi:MerR family transcriptional regulator [Actinomyces faecalis]|uniref:MerR family transcriptional regulator n=1 Tax=Actinomyces faecalis TaxID=2722820 RepID=UPI001C12CFEA|nr:MerR family transcriptional regulator [Actinomyces faecalis]